MSHKTTTYYKILPVILVLFALSGCTTIKSGYKEIPPAPADTRPIAAPASELPPYKLQLGDTLDIKFPLNPELDESVSVRPDGMISTAIARDVMVYNKTVSDVNNALEGEYSSLLDDPMLSVIVRSYAPMRVYVSGEVNGPGEYVTIGHPMTLTQAIARAGGIKNSGQDKNVLIIRRGESENPEAFTADYFAITQQGKVTQDPRLAAYDVVFVPKTGTALVYEEYEQMLQQFVSPSISASYSID